jgi:hypothetical protein
MVATRGVEVFLRRFCVVEFLAQHNGFETIMVTKALTMIAKMLTIIRAN